jgi:hypothetical protein
VQGAVRTVFELFERESSAYAVVRRFQELSRDSLVGQRIAVSL